MGPMISHCLFLNVQLPPLLWSTPASFEKDNMRVQLGRMESTKAYIYLLSTDVPLYFRYLKLNEINHMCKVKAILALSSMNKTVSSKMNEGTEEPSPAFSLITTLYAGLNFSSSGLFSYQEERILSKRRRLVRFLVIFCKESTRHYAIQLLHQ